MTIPVASCGVRFAMKFKIVLMGLTNQHVLVQRLKVHIVPILTTSVVPTVDASAKSLFVTPLTAVVTVPTNRIVLTRNPVTLEPARKPAKLRSILIEQLQPRRL